MSRSRQILPRTPSRHALGLEHHGGTRLLESIGVASRSFGGLTPPSPNHPSMYQASMANRRRALPPVHRRTCASVHRGLHHLPPVHRRASCPSEDFCLSPSRTCPPLTITHHTRRAMRLIHWLPAAPSALLAACRSPPAVRGLPSVAPSSLGVDRASRPEELPFQSSSMSPATLSFPSRGEHSNLDTFLVLSSSP